jgi:uroporphyrin-III C-methyltransferase
MEHNLIPCGKVYICGAGPGEPELLTVKAMRLLKTCEVILYDRLVTKEILELVPDRSRKIYVGRKSGDPTVNQKETFRKSWQENIEIEGWRSIHFR